MSESSIELALKGQRFGVQLFLVLERRVVLDVRPRRLRLLLENLIDRAHVVEPERSDVVDIWTDEEVLVSDVGGRHVRRWMKEGYVRVQEAPPPPPCTLSRATSVLSATSADVGTIGALADRPMAWLAERTMEGVSSEAVNVTRRADKQKRRREVAN